MSAIEQPFQTLKEIFACQDNEWKKKKATIGAWVNIKLNVGL